VPRLDSRDIISCNNDEIQSLACVGLPEIYRLRLRTIYPSSETLEASFLSELFEIYPPNHIT